MNNLIQTITDYTTALEQKIAALEARVAQLEAHIEELTVAEQGALDRYCLLQSRIDTLVEVCATPVANDPEVEIELIVEEELEEEKSQEELPNEMETLDIVDTTEEETTTTPTIEPVLEPIIEPEPIAEPVEEPAMEPAPEPVTEPIAEPVAQPTPKAASAPAPKPAHRPMPQQTSLFGTTVDDIRQAISLGDRFLFQRELFAGNGELMQKTLDELNALDSLKEAMDYVADNFEWDSDSTAVQLFENVLKRRFV